MFLTAAQSLFACAILAGSAISLAEAGILASLFFVQAAIPNTRIRLGFAALYLVPAALMLRRHRRHLRAWCGCAGRPPGADGPARASSAPPESHGERRL